MSDSERTPESFDLVVHSDPVHEYSFLYPRNWYRSSIEGTTGRGVIYSPYPDDISTSFSVETIDLGTKVTKRDLRVLREGLEAGLKQFPESEIESIETISLSYRIGVEAVHRYRQDGKTHKRWVRMEFKDSIQARLVAQGATVEDFERWKEPFCSAMRTFQFSGWFTHMEAMKEIWPQIKAEIEEARTSDTRAMEERERTTGS